MTDSHHVVVLVLASIAIGCSIGYITLLLCRMMWQKRAALETFEQTRREELRRENGLYRRFEPLIDEVKILFDDPPRSNQLAHHLKLGTESLPWKPEEFMATKTIEATLIGFAIFGLISLFGMPIMAFVLAGITAMMYPTLARGSVFSESKRRLNKIKLRLPFAIDQISLMMEAGAGFEDSLRTIVADNREHPLSIEFAEVVRQMSLGRPRPQALTEFRDRIADDDISEIVFAIVKGEELGTPLSNILRDQANQMRLKRSQWGEKAATEAEVQMVFPGMLTMVACLLVIVAPIMLPVVIKLLEG